MQLDQHYESPSFHGLETPSMSNILFKYGLFAQFHVALGVNITSFGNFSLKKKKILSVSL